MLFDIQLWLQKCRPIMIFLLDMAKLYLFLDRKLLLTMPGDVLQTNSCPRKQNQI